MKIKLEITDAWSDECTKGYHWTIMRDNGRGWFNTGHGEMSDTFDNAAVHGMLALISHNVNSENNIKNY